MRAILINIGQNIKKLRELRNYTQQYMAENLGMSQSGYGKLERGQSDMSLLKLFKIAEVLEVNIDAILKFNVELILQQEKIVSENLGDPLSKQNMQHIHQILSEINFLKDEMSLIKSRDR